MRNKKEKNKEFTPQEQEIAKQRIAEILEISESDIEYNNIEEFSPEKKHIKMFIIREKTFIKDDATQKNRFLKKNTRVSFGF